MSQLQVRLFQFILILDNQTPIIQDIVLMISNVSINALYIISRE